MGFNLKKAAKGAIGGVAAGGIVGAQAGGLLGGLGAFDSGTTEQSQVPLETPEQRNARQLLMRYATTGQIGDNFTAGEDIGLAQGNYGMTGLEQQGQSALQALINSGTPAGYAVSDRATADLMNTSTEGLAAMFSPFSAIADRNNALAESSAKRSAAFGGNLYSSDTIRNLGDVNAKTAETKNAELARLTEGALNRKLSAAGLAQQSAAGQENISRNRIADTFNYGSLERNLANAKVQEQNTEALRRRQEVLGQLQGATAVSGANVQWGVPSVTTQNPNPYLDFLKMAMQMGGAALPLMA